MTTQAPYELVYDYLPLKYEEQRAFSETYGFAGSQGLVHLDAVMVRPKGVPSDTLMVMMHPAVSQHILPLPQALVAQGIHVMCAQHRFFKNDSVLVFEKALLDLGYCVRYAKEVLGYKKVVLIGWSGGGPLMMYYQSQAEHPTVTHTPAGDPLDLTAAKLVPADAVIFQAASVSRARILAEYIDPSVTDELDPDRRNPELDIYDPRNPNRAPYSADFIAAYRAAQLARVRRITARVKEQLASFGQRGGVEVERAFCVYRTMADLRFFDLSIDPNDRQAGVCFVGNPEQANTGPIGFARFCTLRSWLSQWSIDDSLADAVVAARNIRVPLLAIENGGDDGAPASHVREVFDAAVSPDRQLHRIPGANHYYAKQPELLAQAVAVETAWLRERGLMPA